MTDTTISLGLWILLLWGVGLLRLNLLVKRSTKILFFPGLLLEALIRTIACLVTGTPIEKFRLFASQQPLLRTGRCPVQRIGVPIAMVIRLLLTFVCTLTLLKLTVPTFTEGEYGLPVLLKHPDGLQGIGWGLWALFSDLPQVLDLSSPLTWFAIYTVFTLSLATGLNTVEFFASCWGWGALVGGASLVGWLDVKFSFMGRGWFLERWYLPECWAAFSFLVTMTFLALLLLFTLHALPWFATKIRPKPTAVPQGMAIEG